MQNNLITKQNLLNKVRAEIEELSEYKVRKAYKIEIIKLSKFQLQKGLETKSTGRNCRIGKRDNRG